MRASGVPERFCTGDAAPREKFLAWAKTVPQTLRNPLYHWTHLELKRYFDIDQLLDETTADSVWERANDQGAWEIGFEVADDLETIFRGKAVYLAGVDAVGYSACCLAPRVVRA